MAAVEFTLNGKTRSLDADPATPLLWILRDHFGLTGTKFGCGMAQCHACTIHLNGAAIPSCQVRLEDAAGARIVTIEGLSEDGGHPLQEVWSALSVAQCGYCQPGMIMAAAGLLGTNANPGDDQIDAAIGNICRCGTYPRVRAAIHRAAQVMARGAS